MVEKVWEASIWFSCPCNLKKFKKAMILPVLVLTINISNIDIVRINIGHIVRINIGQHHM